MSGNGLDYILSLIDQYVGWWLVIVSLFLMGSLWLAGKYYLYWLRRSREQ